MAGCCNVCSACCYVIQPGCYLQHGAYINATWQKVLALTAAQKTRYVHVVMNGKV